MDTGKTLTEIQHHADLGVESAAFAYKRAKRWELILVCLLAAYYLGRLLYFAIVIAPDLPPDEETHVGIISLYAEAPLFIEDSPRSYPLGLVTHVPYLYHLLLGKLLAINVLGIDTYLYLRLWNVILALCTLLSSYWLAIRLTDSAEVRLLFVVLVTNTLMVTFLSASVSYDNLVNLLSVLSVLLAFSYFEVPSALRLLGFVAVLLAGGLTKYSFLPLAAIMLLVVLFERRRELGQDARQLMAEIGSFNPIVLGLTGLVSLLLLANIWLYGGNLSQYGRLNPGCSQVLALDACMENRIFARNWIVQQYLEGSTSFEQAVQATQRIPHAGDREHAMRLLENERSYQITRPQALNVFAYIRLVWDRAIKPTIFGIQAHRSILRDPNSLWPYELILLIAFVLWVRHLNWEAEERKWLYLTVIALAYFLLLVGFVNYRGYLATHAPLVGVQGRYIFPVLWFGYLVVARALLSVSRTGVRRIILVLVAGWFLAGDLPFFLSRVSSDWLRQGPQSILLGS